MIGELEWRDLRAVSICFVLRSATLSRPFGVGGGAAVFTRRWSIAACCFSTVAPFVAQPALLRSLAVVALKEGRWWMHYVDAALVINNSTAQPARPISNQQPIRNSDENLYFLVFFTLLICFLPLQTTHLNLTFFCFKKTTCEKKSFSESKRIATNEAEKQFYR